MERCWFATETRFKGSNDSQLTLTGSNFLSFHSHRPEHTHIHIHTHLTHLSAPASPSADETLMIMMMSNDDHFTALTLAGSHFPACGSRALSYECSRCGHIKKTDAE